MASYIQKAKKIADYKGERECIIGFKRQLDKTFYCTSAYIAGEADKGNLCRSIAKLENLIAELKASMSIDHTVSDCKKGFLDKEYIEIGLARKE